VKNVAYYHFNRDSDRTEHSSKKKRKEGGRGIRILFLFSLFFELAISMLRAMTQTGGKGKKEVTPLSSIPYFRLQTSPRKGEKEKRKNQVRFFSYHLVLIPPPRSLGRKREGKKKRGKALPGISAYEHLATAGRGKGRGRALSLRALLD